MVATPIASTVYRRDRESVRQLIDSGWEIDAYDEKGQTALVYAICSVIPGRDRDFIAYLLSLGADPSIPERQRTRTPLHMVAQDGDTEVAELLLEHGANPNAQEENGNTPLWEAVFRAGKSGVSPMIQVLVAAGADPTMKNNSGVSSLDLAKNLSKQDAYQFLTSVGDRCDR